ncbi:hypothetical protein R6Q59_031145 [Mikania micrantha]
MKRKQKRLWRRRRRFRGSDDLKFTVLSVSSGDSTGDVNVSVSPSDDLFFKAVSFRWTTRLKLTQSRLSFVYSLMKSATISIYDVEVQKSKSNDNRLNVRIRMRLFLNSDSKEEHKPIPAN